MPLLRKLILKLMVFSKFKIHKVADSNTDFTDLEAFDFSLNAVEYRNDNNQIIIKNTRQSREKQEIDQMMQRLDAIDLNQNSISNDKSCNYLEEEEESYHQDFTNIVFY